MQYENAVEYLRNTLNDLYPGAEINLEAKQVTFGLSLEVTKGTRDIPTELLNTTLNEIRKYAEAGGGITQLDIIEKNATHIHIAVCR